MAGYKIKNKRQKESPSENWPKRKAEEFGRKCN